MVGSRTFPNSKIENPRVHDFTPFCDGKESISKIPPVSVALISDLNSFHVQRLTEARGQLINVHSRMDLGNISKPGKIDFRGNLFIGSLSNPQHAGKLVFLDHSTHQDIVCNFRCKGQCSPSDVQYQRNVSSKDRSQWIGRTSDLDLIVFRLALYGFYAKELEPDLSVLQSYTSRISVEASREEFKMCGLSQHTFLLTLGCGNQQINFFAFPIGLESSNVLMIRLSQKEKGDGHRSQEPKHDPVHH